MTRFILLVVPTLFAAIPSAAQDSIPYDNLGAAQSIAGTMALNSHLSGPRSRAARSRASEAEARRTCRTVPRLQQRYGARDPRVTDLQQLCRRLGY